MKTYSVIIITRELEKYGYLINAESAEVAKRKAICKCGFYGIKAPFREVVVYATENFWAAMDY